MEINNIIRRRQSHLSSGYNQGLLQNDHLEGTRARTVDNIDWLRNQSSDRSSGLSSYNRINVIDNSRYAPPESYQDATNQGGDAYTGTQQNFESLLYLSTPKPTSVRRILQTQTPSRTMSMYNTTNAYRTNDSVLKRDPAHDYGSDSLLSYGCWCVQCVRTTEVGIAETFGRYEKLLEPGIHFLPWPFVDISGRLSLRIKQLDITCETKTSDSVFCYIVITLQFRIITERAYDAYYRLSDPSHQIKSYAFDVIRSKVPKMTLDEVFTCKEGLAKEVKNRLENVLKDYGYEIIDSLLTDIRPAFSVIHSMNEINASKRLKVAMIHKAEAEKIKRVKEGEAHCEELYLHGVGIAGQRRALAQGMKSALETVENNDMGPTKKEVITLLFMTQYMDMIVSLSSSHSGNNCDLLYDGGPEHVMILKDQLQTF